MAHMQVILTEALQGVGKIGEIVRVKAGFARNFLLPRAKAMVATKDNLAVFASQKTALEAKSAAARGEAEKRAAQFANLTLDLARHASETGQLYGSIKAKDFAAELTRKGLNVDASAVMLASAVKDVGTHTIKVALHPEVIITVPVVVSRQSL